MAQPADRRTWPCHWKRYAATFAALMVLAGCGRNDEAALLASAQKRLERQDYAGATIDLKNVLKENPGSAAGRYLFGRVLLESGDVPGAEAELQRAERFGYPQAELYPVLAALLRAKDTPAATVERFKDVKLPDAKGAAALATELAAAHLELGDPASAEAALADALARVPDHVTALVLRARLAAQAGDLDTTRRIAADLLGRHPEDASVWVLHGELLVTDGKEPAAAIAAFRKAVELQPRSLGGHAALITLLVRQREFKQAEAAAAAMRKALPRHRMPAYFQALTAFLQNDFVQARAHLQRLSGIVEQDPMLQLLAGSTEARLGALAQAENLLNRAVKSNPGAAPPRRELAAVYLRQGQPERALAVVEPLLGAESKDADAWRLAGLAQTALGDFARADRAFARATELRPEDATIKLDVARSTLAKGQTERGLAELEAAAKLDLTGIGAELELVGALMRKKDVDGALRVADSISTKQSGSPAGDYLRGRIQAASGDPASARDAYSKALTKDPRHVASVQRLVELDLAAGQPDAARKRYEALLKVEPRSAPAMLGMADLTRRTGGPRDQALAWLDKAVKANALDAPTWIAAIQFHRTIGDGPGTLARARAAGAALPSDPEVQGLLADAQIAERDLQQAVATLNRVLASRPTSAETHLRLVAAQLSAGNPDRARFHADQALRLAPDLPIALRAVTSLALLDKRPVRAYEVARAVQTRRPSAALGWQLEGEIEAAQGNLVASEAAFRKALGKEVKTEVALQLNAVLNRAGNRAVASRFAADWLQSHPRDVTFLAQLAEQAMAAGNWREAETRYREAVKLLPDSPGLLNNLAYVLVQRKDKEAVAVALQAQRLAPYTANVLDTLAQAYDADGQAAKAIEWQTRAVEYAPQEGAFRLRLAKMHLAGGDKKKAREELQRLRNQSGGAVPPAELEKLQAQAQG